MSDMAKTLTLMLWLGDDYFNWSKLFHLKKLISVDLSLNEDFFDPNRDHEEDWKSIVQDGYYETGFYRSLDYVLRKMKAKERFNRLAAAIHPTEDCKSVKLDNFDFLGYNLSDQEYTHRALSNCGGFNETFLPSD